MKLAGKIFAPGILVLTALIILPSAARAQENTYESPHHVTGCLRQRAAANIYTLTDEDSKIWDLRSRTVALAPHVGHTVTATGTIPKTQRPTNPQTTTPRRIIWWSPQRRWSATAASLSSRANVLE